MRHFEDEPRLLPLSTLLRETVRNSSGEQLGQIRDVIVDAEAGCIAYAVLSFGGFLGLGKRLFAVPWRALAFDPADETLYLDVTRKQLEEVPAFDSDDWPDVSDRRWGTEVHQFFDQKPYWECATKKGIAEHARDT